MTTTPRTTGTIGTAGAAFTLIGFVVGASIFVLPGEIASVTGPAVVWSYAIAGTAALFSCMVAAQIGVLMPRSGAGFTAVAAHVSPFCGFLVIWLMIGAAALTVAFLADGFAYYLRFLWPVLNQKFTAFAILFTCVTLNFLGIRSAVWTQALLVLVLMSVLAVFSAVALSNLTPANLTPFMPNGFFPVVQSAVPAFFSFLGFMVIIEIGGELKRPRRTVPLALLVSFMVVMLTYLLVALSIVGVVNWRELSSIEAPAAAVAGLLFPPWAGNILTISVLVAAATSINAMILGYSRYVIPMARVGLLPPRFAYLTRKGHTPIAGVLLILLLSSCALSVGESLTRVATLIVVAVMVVQFLLGLALIRMRLGDNAHRVKPLSLEMVGALLSGGGLMAVSVLFLLASIQGQAEIIMLMVLYAVVGALLYLLRRHMVRAAGRDLDRAIHEEASITT